MIFQNSMLPLLYDFNWFLPAWYGQLFLFWSKLQQFPYMGGVSVLGTCCKFYHHFVFQSIVQSNFSRQPIAVLHFSGFFRHAVWRCYSREKFSQTICHHKKGTCSTSFVLIYELFHPFNLFLNEYSRFLKQNKLIDSSPYICSFLLWSFHIWYTVMGSTCYIFCHYCFFIGSVKLLQILRLFQNFL